MGVKRRLLVYLCLVITAGIVFAVIWPKDSRADTASVQTAEISEEPESKEADLYSEGPAVSEDEMLEKSFEHVHDFVRSVWETPTCQQGGYYNNICSGCGIVECVIQETLPHEVEDILIQEGNCMEDTIVRHICKMCGGQVESDTRYTPAEGHSWVFKTVDGVELNCCVNCGVVR